MTGVLTIALTCRAGAGARSAALVTSTCIAIASVVPFFQAGWVFVMTCDDGCGNTGSWRTEEGSWQWTAQFLIALTATAAAVAAVVLIARRSNARAAAAAAASMALWLIWAWCF